MNPPSSSLLSYLKPAAFIILSAANLVGASSARAAEAPQPITRLEPLVVVAPKSAELVGPYHQPRWSARGRFSSDTEVYVLPPWECFLDLDYQLTVPRHGTSTHLFTQELEIGLPYHFQVAYENNFEVVGRRAQATVQTLEARWAPADWGKIPLNPTLFAEYKFGIGRPREHDREEAETGEEGGIDAEEEQEPDRSSRIPNSFEVRLLLGQQFGEHLQWAFNIFHEQEVGGDRETETGFSQALSYSILEETLRAGIEMQFIRRTERDSRHEPAYEFDIGPSFSWKPSKRTRLDVAALFGTTDDSPALKLFAVFSIDFGSVAEKEAEAPVSTRNR